MVEDLIKSICDKVLDELKKSYFSSFLFDVDGKLTVAGCLAATYLSSAMAEQWGGKVDA